MPELKQRQDLVFTALALGLVAVASILSPFLGLPALGAVLAIFLLTRATPSELRLPLVIAVLAIGGIDGLPGPDLTTVHLSQGLNAQDFDVFGLCVALLIYNLRYGSGRLLSSTLGRIVVASSLLFTVLWLMTIYRTISDSAMPFVNAANYGHDLLSFAVMLPLFVRPLQDRNTRKVIAAVVGADVCIESLLYIAEALSGKSFGFLLHVHNTILQGGLTRPYSPVQDLFVAGVPLGLAVAAMGPSRRVRAYGAVVTVLTLLATIAGQTRAQYVGVTAGIAVAALLWLANSEPRARAARNRVLRALAAFVLVVATLALIPGGPTSKVLSTASSRLSSISSTVANKDPSQSTVAVRLNDVRVLDQLLRGHKTFGVGFLDPSYVYESQLENGSLRNPDVGIYNVVATMGISGTAVYYLPAVAITLWLLVGIRARSTERWMLTSAVFAWSVSTLIDSLTLITLFSPTGVVVAAAMLALGVAIVLQDDESPPVVSGSTRFSFVQLRSKRYRLRRSKRVSIA
jgi:hypothetical protein